MTPRKGSALTRLSSQDFAPIETFDDLLHVMGIDEENATSSGETTALRAQELRISADRIAAMESGRALRIATREEDVEDWGKHDNSAQKRRDVRYLLSLGASVASIAAEVCVSRRFVYIEAEAMLRERIGDGDGALPARGEAVAENGGEI